MTVSLSLQRSMDDAVLAGVFEAAAPLGSLCRSAGRFREWARLSDQGGGGIDVVGFPRTPLSSCYWRG